MMRSILKGIKELVVGMGITGKHLGKHAITIQYPEEKWTMPERSRGIVVLLSDKETGDLNCTGCMLCMRACPTAAIYVDAPRDENKKRHLKAFTVDHSLCCFCGLCEEACNFSALKMAAKYEFSTVNKEDLVWDMKKLQEVGSDVPYIDTRKKKPVKQPKPDDKPSETKDAESFNVPESSKPSTTLPIPESGEEKTEKKDGNDL